MGLAPELRNSWYQHVIVTSDTWLCRFNKMNLREFLKAKGTQVVSCFINGWDKNMEEINHDLARKWQSSNWGTLDADSRSAGKEIQ